MTSADLLRLRLRHQQLTVATCSSPAALLRHLGAMQAQDYAQSLWTVGVRLPGSSAAAVAQALAAGRIVRSWLLRGTLHLAAAEDVRWLLDLVAPRLMTACAAIYRQRELDAATFTRSFAVFEQALQHRQPQPRSVLAGALQQAGIRPDGPRLYSLLQRAVWEKLVCPAGRLGAEPTYALLDDWLPPAPALSRPEAVAELARRYFRSHGPATVADFAWWAGLPLGQARQGLEAAQPGLQSAVLDGHSYWWPAAAGPAPAAPPLLLPAFDEYLIAYKNRELLLDPARARQVMTTNGIFRPIIVVDGRVAGTWRRQTGRTGGVELAPFEPLPVEVGEQLAAAAATVERFYQS